MKSKGMEKLFSIVYNDALTDVYNRKAYEEALHKLRHKNVTLDNVTVMVTELVNLKHINDVFGHHTGDEALVTMSKCLVRTVGQYADMYRINGNTLVCISNRDILSYMSEFRDLVSFENRERIYPITVCVGYERCDSKKHKSIDDMLKDADKRLLADKKKKIKTR